MAVNVIAVNIGSGLPQTRGDEVEHPVGDELLAGGAGRAERAIEKQRRKPVNCSPRSFVETVAAIRREHARGDKIVNAPDKNLERMPITECVVRAIRMTLMD